MSDRLTLKLWKDDMGTFTQPGCRDAEDALWHINSARTHDGLTPITLEELQDALSHPENSEFRATLERTNNPSQRTALPQRAFLYALRAIDDEGFHLLRDRKAETVVDRNTFISWAAKGSIDPMSLVNYGLNAFHASKSTTADLLAALEEITERYEQLDTRLVAGQHTEPNGTISRAKAAIAKAKTLSA